ncbi:MAG: hypothetical protein NZ903_01620, partial [Candidatus Micrarchaeota archaeon]|nr:hypothetical protein [Candidatus Micrarchaeota archaeon]
GTGGLQSEANLSYEYICRLHEYYEIMINEELQREIANYKDVLLIIDADKNFAPKDLIRFHNYIEERAHRLLMKRGFYKNHKR